MEYERDVDYTDETSGYDFLAEIDAILAEAEGDEEEVAVDDTEVTVDGEENIDVDTTAEVDPNVKAVQDALTQAQAAAQKLGDKKLTDQIGNTITFFTRAHVVDKGAIAEADEMELSNMQYVLDWWEELPFETKKEIFHQHHEDEDASNKYKGAVAEGEEDVTSIGKKVEAAVEDKLETTVSKLSDEQKDQLKAELAKLGVTATSNVKDVAAKLNESLYEAEGDTKAKVASALQDVGGGLMKSLLVPIIPVAIGSLGPGVAAGFAITAGVAGALIGLAKLLGAEKSMEEGKKEYYKDAEADDAEHIKALEKDMKDDKESSMKIKEVVFPMWQRINK
jgi:hypothetical protein